MANKITKKDCFIMLLAIDEVLTNQDLVKFINHELELLEKKNANRKNELTITQLENLEYAKQFLAYIGEHPDTPISVLGKVFGLKSQRVTPIVKKLELEGKIVGKLEKRVYYYTLA